MDGVMLGWMDASESFVIRRFSLDNNARLDCLLWTVSESRERHGGWVIVSASSQWAYEDGAEQCQCPRAARQASEQSMPEKKGGWALSSRHSTARPTLVAKVTMECCSGRGLERVVSEGIKALLPRGISTCNSQPKLLACGAAIFDKSGCVTWAFWRLEKGRRL